MGIDWEKRTETCDFWVGTFPNEDMFSDYIGESPSYYDAFDRNSPTISVRLKPSIDDVEPRDHSSALSKFIADQGRTWYDHDLLEAGFNANANTIKELVDGYSYSDQYVGELTERAKATGIQGINAFLFIRSGEIGHPRSVKTDNFEFRYVGRITYRI
jgi:hypothetical protein